MPTANSKPEVSLVEQLACARREFAMRRKMYPQWVHAKRMNVFKAEEELAAMEAIVKTLTRLVDSETPRLL